MNRLKLGLDIDSVVCEIMPTVVGRINARYQTNYSKADITNWDFETEEFDLHDEIMRAFADKKNLMNFPQVDCAATGVWYLKDDFEIVFVTSRPPEYRRYTERWIEKNFGKFPVFHVNGDKNGLGLDILVDDAPHNIRDFAAHGKPCVIFDQPWNRTETFDERLVRRADTWFAAVGAVRELRWEFYLKGDEKDGGRREDKENHGDGAATDGAGEGRGEIDRDG